MRFLCPTFFTPLSLCGVVSIEIRQKTSTRDTRIKNVLRIHVSQNRAGREFCRNSGEITQYQGMFLSLPFARKVLIFFFSCFFVGEAKRSQIWWPNGVRGSFIVYVARRRDGREMDAPPFVSVQKYIRRENVCEERDTFAPLSLREAGFPRRARETKGFGWKGKKRVKTSKRGCFLVFAYPFLLSQKKQISHQILSYVYSFKHRLQSPRCAWLKTKT